ncbi:MAG: zinc/manganese transport system substrate-binding protein [Solirubrobacteraceae bacterium]|nr:zinc/manganese transport system substrate-binding protein [Solirubrobacteraceae bacterium]
MATPALLRPVRQGSRAWVLTLAVTLAALLALSGCGQGAAASSGPPHIVAAENMWGSIAAQLAGSNARITSIITNPAQDPHSYEPTAPDARTLATAGLVIVNGIGYDEWSGRLLAANPQPSRLVLDVGTLLKVPSGGNPHRWYDPNEVSTVAQAIEADLARLDPHHQALYAQRLRSFETVALAPYHQAIAAVRRHYAGVPVGASESIFALQAPALGLRLLTPATFMKAISEGTEVSARDTATAADQITHHRIKVWVFNSQNATPEIAHLNALARANGIPVTTITETLAPATDSFEQWQVAQLRALARALHAATGR